MFKSRRRALLLVLPVVAAVALVLSWYDVLPGGWTLRGWVRPHAVRLAREQARYSQRRVASFEEENRAAPTGTVVWLGSSTIERFPLDELLPGHRHLNRGIGNESAAGLLERLDRSLPDACPRAVVLYVGSIDFREQGRAPAAILRSTEAVIERVRERYAGDPPRFLVLGLLPERTMPAEMVGRLAETNAALAELAGADDVWFVDPNRTSIAGENGWLEARFAADRLHLNREGYQVLADAIRGVTGF